MEKHLEFIQAAIGRMANNSFLLKGWTVTLSAALFALAAKDANPSFAAIALLPTFAFWALDAYYLRLERQYRCLYDEVIEVAKEGACAVQPYSMSVDAYSDRVESVVRLMFSTRVAFLHGTVAVAICIVLGLFRWFRA